MTPAERLQRQRNGIDSHDRSRRALRWTDPDSPWMSDSNALTLTSDDTGGLGSGWGRYPRGAHVPRKQKAPQRCSVCKHTGHNRMRCGVHPMKRAA